MRFLCRALPKRLLSSKLSSHKPAASGVAQPKEENPQNYRPGGFHPVVVGSSFSDSRYHVIRKLGFGVYSTVWLCRDKQ